MASIQEVGLQEPVSTDARRMQHSRSMCGQTMRTLLHHLNAAVFLLLPCCLSTEAVPVPVCMCMCVCVPLQIDVLEVDGEIYGFSGCHR